MKTLVFFIIGLAVLYHTLVPYRVYVKNNISHKTEGVYKGSQDFRGIDSLNACNSFVDKINRTKTFNSKLITLYCKRQKLF